MSISELVHTIECHNHDATATYQVPQLTEQEFQLFQRHQLASKIPGSMLLLLQLGQSRMLCDIEILDMLSQMHQYLNFFELQRSPQRFLTETQQRGLTQKNSLHYVHHIMQKSHPLGSAQTCLV